MTTVDVTPAIMQGMATTVAKTRGREERMTTVPRNTAPWEAVGVNVEGALTASEAITQANLDWEVGLAPVYSTFPDQQLVDAGFPPEQVLKHIEDPRHKAVQRQTDGKVLGIVGNRYHPIQNRKGFDFIDNLVDSGDAKYVNVGTIGDGRLIYLQAKLPEGVTVAGEPLDQYLTLSNSHDGGSSCHVLFTPIRIWCQNTLNMAVARAKNKVSMRHTASARTKLHDARTLLDIGFSYFEEVARIGEAAALTKIDDAEFERFLKTLVPDPTGEDASTARAESKRADIRRVYNKADNLNNIKGTAWGAYNAVVEYDDHYATVKGKSPEESRLVRAVFKPNLKAEAAKLLLPA